MNQSRSASAGSRPITIPLAVRSWPTRNAPHFSVPPGAIGGATEISMTPMLRVPDEMAAPFVGPIVDLRIGDHQHFIFRRPVTLTLPYEDAGDGNQPSIGVWENGRWTALPSKVDRDQKTVTAELPHASYIAPIAYGQTVNLAARIGIGAVAGTAVGTAVAIMLPVIAEQLRVERRRWQFVGPSVDEYETPRGNFKSVCLDHRQGCGSG